MAKQIAFDIIARDKASKTFGKIGSAAKLLGVVGLGAVVTNAVQTEAAFGKTMNLMQAGSGASGKEMEKLRALAVKMGADTQFSAGQAADAMLELTKAGISPAKIQAGALQGTLTLAAAGGLEMASAATIAGNALNTFGLQAKDMNSVAAALAGGANASTASVESMGMALSQVGPGAKTAGLSIQETTAVLAAFDNAGIKGSDAGTSLKTMLTRLVPSTKKAEGAMKELGLKFTDAHGNFKSISNISEQLRKKMGGLSDAQRTQAMSAIFGSDATRAATVLMGEGAKGVNKLIKATSDQGAAQRMANASMKGTGGALERMSGSLETASLAIGQMLAPAVVFLADVVGTAANAFVSSAPEIKKLGAAILDVFAPVVKLGAAIGDMAVPVGKLGLEVVRMTTGFGDSAPKVKSLTGFVQNNKTTLLALAATIAAVVTITKIHTAVMAIQAAGGLLPLLKATKLVSAATKAYTAVMWALNAAQKANVIFLVIAAIVALIAIIIVIEKKTGFFSKVWAKAWGGIKAAFWAVFGFIKRNWPMILPILFGPIGLAAALIIKKWGAIKTGAAGVVDFVKSIPGKLRDLGSKFGDAGSFLIGKFLGGLRKVGGVIANIAGDIWGFIKGFFNSAIGGINAAIPDKITLKGMPDLDLPNNPFPTFARGGLPRAGWGIVGERGPELVRFGGGERVFSNRDSARMGGGGTTIQIVINGPTDPMGAAREVRKILLQLKRTSGVELGLA